jgi:hypothetical protein
MVVGVPILGEDDSLEEVFVLLEEVNGLEDLLAFWDTQRASFAKIILHIDDDKSPRHILFILSTLVVTKNKSIFIS